MNVEINLSEYSRSFIYEIAEHTTSPEILDQIVDFAINVDHYADFSGGESEKDFYMERVVDNEHLSKESIVKLIHYKEACDVHFALADGDKINDELADVFLSEVKDLSVIERYFRKNAVSQKLADMVADRIISRKIYIEDCFIYTQGNDYDEVNDAICRICKFCSSEKEKQLTAWWEEESKHFIWNQNAFADAIAECIMDEGERIDAKLPVFLFKMRSAIEDIAFCCSDEVGERLKKWWKRKSRE